MEPSSRTLPARLRPPPIEYLESLGHSDPTDKDSIRAASFYRTVHSKVLMQTYEMSIAPRQFYWSYNNGQLYAALATEFAEKPMHPVSRGHITIIQERVAVQDDIVHAALAAARNTIPEVTLKIEFVNYGGGLHFLVKQDSMVYHLCNSLQKIVSEAIDHRFVWGDFHVSWRF